MKGLGGFNVVGRRPGSGGQIHHTAGDDLLEGHHLAEWVLCSPTGLAHFVASPSSAGLIHPPVIVEELLVEERAAEEAGLNPRHFQKNEAGSVNVTLHTVARLSAGFGVDAKRLFEP